MNNGNLEEALKLAQVAFEQLPDEPNVADTLAWIFVKKDMAARAVPLLETAVKTLPAEPQIRYHLGMAYFKTGDWKKSKAELERALSLKPDLIGADDARKTLAIVGGAPS
jgi:tetratricopeptide (TPR) repeat protein